MNIIAQNMMDKYRSPLSDRYASKEMKEIFSPYKRVETWRTLWIELAKHESMLGLPITREQIEELKSHKDYINWDLAERIEAETHHDVMAHIRTYGSCCPNAAGIIHLGATSSYITDNADVIIMRDAMTLVKAKLNGIIRRLSELALLYASMPTLAYTHYQPAQPTTVGKRMCIWLQDFKSDMDDLVYVYDSMKMLGCKGATGTQASFLSLFDGDYDKVEKLDEYICHVFGMKSYPITGQTYPRKQDKRIYDVLSSIAVSASKIANDIRLLQHDGEMNELFGNMQVGSSAMAYKRNPINCEKIVGLSRRVITDSLNPALTASVQWLERTLDDSANRRLVISEGFLTIDEILDTLLDVLAGIGVNKISIPEHLNKELPHLAMEDIIMALTKMGYDRQEVHETMRQISMARCDVKSEIAQTYGLRLHEVDKMCNINTGCAERQARNYLKENGYDIMED